MHGTRAAFGAMEQAVFVRPAAEAMAGRIARRRAQIFPIVRGTRDREISEIEREIRKMATSIACEPRKIDGPTQMREKSTG